MTLVSGDEKYGLMFNANEKLWSEDVALRSYPFYLVSYQGIEQSPGNFIFHWTSVGHEEQYKLPEYYFKERYKKYLVGQFLRSKCR